MHKRIPSWKICIAIVTSFAFNKYYPHLLAYGLQNSSVKRRAK